LWRQLAEFARYIPIARGFKRVWEPFFAGIGDHKCSETTFDNPAPRCHISGESRSRNVMVHLTNETGRSIMGKFIPEPFDVHQSFSHGRTTPVIVEKVKRPAGILCPCCGGKMKLARRTKLTAVCPRGCEQENK
jgi:hypothetical protein